jgi:hypothetical protein
MLKATLKPWPKTVLVRTSAGCQPVSAGAPGSTSAVTTPRHAMRGCVRAGRGRGLLGVSSCSTVGDGADLDLVGEVAGGAAEPFGRRRRPPGQRPSPPLRWLAAFPQIQVTCPSSVVRPRAYPVHLSVAAIRLPPPSLEIAPHLWLCEGWPRPLAAAGLLSQDVETFHTYRVDAACRRWAPGRPSTQPTVRTSSRRTGPSTGPARHGIRPQSVCAGFREWVPPTLITPSCRP